MGDIEKQHKIALLSCIEIVLMRRGNTSYNWVLAKLNSLYHCDIGDCYEHPEYLRTVLKEVHGRDYNSIVNDLKTELDDLINVQGIANFLKVLES